MLMDIGKGLEEEICERRKGGDLQQNKGWKWEVGTGRGRSAKGLERVFLKIDLIYILRSRRQSTCGVLMGSERQLLRRRADWQL